MSLLNDALRKKEREMRPPVESAPGAIAPITPRPQRRRLSWIVGIGTAALLAAGLGIGLTVQSIEAPSASILPASSYRSASQSIAPEILPSPVVETLPTAPSPLLPEANTSPAMPGNDARVAKREPILRAPIHPNNQVSPSQMETRPLPQSPNVAAPGDISPTPLNDPNSTEAVEIPSQTVPPLDRHGDVVAEPPLAERYMRKALAYHQQGRLERAIALYREVLQLQPDHFDARFNLASKWSGLYRKGRVRACPSHWPGPIPSGQYQFPSHNQPGHRQNWAGAVPASPNPLGPDRGYPPGRILHGLPS